MSIEPFWRFWINPHTKEAVIMELMEHQEEVIETLDSGKVLYGGVGSGKSMALLGYYMKSEAPADLYVITTAKKRDTLDWEKEAASFGISTEREFSRAGLLTVDSWNNIAKYSNVEGAFFVFDEQRVVGSGEWVTNFLKIATKNRWVLLSATPGDTWMDYAPVFTANGYYESIKDFRERHVVYEPFLRYPKVKFYLGTKKLEKLRNEILVEMRDNREERRKVNWISVGYDKDLFQRVWLKRWNVFEDRPIRDAAELFRVARRVLNEDPSRLDMVRQLMKCHDKIVIFYRFNHELDVLRTLGDEIEVGEWNGHQKDPLPKSDKWLYLVQYTSGSEGWNCTDTNAMIFFSLHPSYRSMEQAMGRIDRMNTPFKALYYYLFVSDSVPDLANKRSLQRKKRFNEVQFVRKNLSWNDTKDKPLSRSEPDSSDLSRR